MMKIKFKEDQPVVKKKVDDYICINGKKLSEQTVFDYAPFIPSWEDRIELKDDSFLVRCVHPHNHLHNDDNFSMVISEGHTRNVVIACRSGCCDNFQILQYFLSRLTGEVPMSANQVSKPKTRFDIYNKENIKHTDHHPLGMSKEKQWALHKKLVALHKTYQREKPWKKLSEEEKSERIQEQIRRSK